MQHHAKTGAIAAADAAMAASPPDLRHPTIILFLAALGGLIGTALGRIRHLPREKIREIAEDATFAGGVIGAGLHLAALGDIFDGTLRGQVIGGILTVAVVHWLLRTYWRR